jgi:hypothetical protein
MRYPLKWTRLALDPQGLLECERYCFERLAALERQNRARWFAGVPYPIWHARACVVAAQYRHFLWCVQFELARVERASYTCSESFLVPQHGGSVD